jgi:dihydrofolate reductase
MPTYVFSRTLSPEAYKDVTVLADDGIARLAELRAEDGKDIWLFGGGVLLGSLASAGLVDGFELSVMPVLLGTGIPLISGNTERVKLKLVSEEHTPAGILSLKYDVDHHG